MKNIIVSTLLLFFFSGLQAQEQNEKNFALKPSAEILKTAEWAGFNYISVYEGAQKGDQALATEFLNFMKMVDGRQAGEHADACLALIPAMGDEKFRPAVVGVSHKMRKILLERLMMAQGRSANEGLRKPMKQWAPQTWALLNNEPIPGISQGVETSKKEASDTEGAGLSPSKNNY